MPRSENRYTLINDNKSFAITNLYLEAHLEGCLEVDGETVVLQNQQDQVTHGTPVNAKIPYWIELTPRAKRSVVARFQLYSDTKVRGNFKPVLVNRRLAASDSAALSLLSSSDPADSRLPLIRNSSIAPLSLVRLKLERSSLEHFIIRRNMDYILGCLAVPVSNEHVALMTDHVALPLGWNRDN
jgi:hypothetical protein